jgi:hypothetical protein
MKDYSGDHWTRTEIGKKMQFEDMSPGMTIMFEYKQEKRVVYLLHAQWKGKLHALETGRIPPTVFTRICQIFEEGIGGGAYVNNPQSFYANYLSRQQAIVEADCYRT